MTESTTESQEKQAQTDINTEQRGDMVPSTGSTTPESQQQWRQYVQPVINVLGELPDRVARFFADYQQPLITLLLILAAIVTVRVTLAVLAAINGIPLLSPIFELIGLGYTGWFVYRYLLKASTRQELGNEFQDLKGQVIGNSSQNS